MSKMFETLSISGISLLLFPKKENLKIRITISTSDISFIHILFRRRRDGKNMKKDLCIASSSIRKRSTIECQYCSGAGL